MLADVYEIKPGAYQCRCDLCESESRIYRDDALHMQYLAERHNERAHPDIWRYRPVAYCTALYPRFSIGT